MDIDKKLNNEITLYCKENGLNKKEFINKLLKKAFNIEKYGEKPFSNTPQTAKTTPEIEKKKEDACKAIRVSLNNKPKEEEIIKEPENKEKNCIFDKEKTESKEPVSKTNKRRLL